MARADPLDFARWLARTGLGASFAYVGWYHVVVSRGILERSLAWLPGDAAQWALIAAWAEVVAGLALLVGAFIPLALTVTVGINLGALAWFLVPSPGFVWSDIAMLGAAAFLFRAGPDRWSVDAMFRAPVTTPPSTGFAIMRGALAVSLVLAAFLTLASPASGVGVAAALLLPGSAALAGVVTLAAAVGFLTGTGTRASAFWVATLGASVFLAHGVTPLAPGWRWFTLIGTAAAVAAARPTGWSLRRGDAAA